ncbi:MAG: phenylalanine--tRNA ligase subunit alpha [Patescibacteria group bacterium]
MLDKLNSLKDEAKTELEKATDPRVLNNAFNKYLGKKGEVNLILRSIKDLPEEERIKTGKEANEVKNILENIYKEKAKSFEIKDDSHEKWIDITLPGVQQEIGHIHPLTQSRREIEEIFSSMGFSVVDGPQMETEFYNFDGLNIPKNHPARDLWDTIYLKNGNLLRTHTSPMQVRYMEKHKPPLRIIIPGRVFRYEATDASHEINFNQVEGLMVGGKGEITVASFKAIIEGFLSNFFGEEIKIRLRPGFFPFTVISFEIDASCPLCDQKGCPACKESGWIELMGAGMVHPSVFKNSGLNPDECQGFAFGMGLERLTMIKRKINDLRLFYSGDIKFLKQF